MYWGNYSPSKCFDQQCDILIFKFVKTTHMSSKNREFLYVPKSWFQRKTFCSGLYFNGDPVTMITIVYIQYIGTIQTESNINICDITTII